MKTVAICAVGVALMAFAAWQRLAGGDDFNQFYRAASLAQAHQSVFAHPSFFPATNSEGAYLPYNRIPSYAAVLLRPLAPLPYPAARWTWTALSALAFLACIWLIPDGRERLAIGLAWSFPVAVTFALGQDIGFVLLIALAAAKVYATEREFSAGLLASLVAIKLSFLPATGLVFLAKSRRGTAGLTVGVALQVAASFAIEGMGWPVVYLASLRRSLTSFEVRRMPVIRAVLVWLTLPEALYIVAAIAIFVWLFVVCRRLRFHDALILALPLGVIASPYCFIYDAALTIPLLVSVASLDSWDGMLAGIALTPLPWLMLMTDSPVTLPLGSVLVVASTLAGAVRFARLRSVPVVSAVPLCLMGESYG